MNEKRKLHTTVQKALLLTAMAVNLTVTPLLAAADGEVFEAGHKSLKVWQLPEMPTSPDDNKYSEQRAALGKQLFFDPRLSGTGQVTCGSCHFPERGWADGLPTAVRFQGKVLTVAAPTIVNTGYNSIYMWDGRMPTLEKQAFAGQGKPADINAGSTVEPEVVVANLNKVSSYVKAFEKAYPGEGLTRETIAKALAAFERTIISRDSAFDRWVNGDKNAMTAQQVNGFKTFVGKAQCVNCHQAPNFTDNGFHNIGLKSFGEENHDQGRFKQRKLKLMDGAFKTPTLRDISLTAPYFHDGSAPTLTAVVEHYAQGGVVKTNLSPTLPQGLNLTEQDKSDIVAFLGALTTQHPVFVYPVLPRE